MSTVDTTITVATRLYASPEGVNISSTVAIALHNDYLIQHDFDIFEWSFFNHCFYSMLKTKQELLLRCKASNVVSGISEQPIPFKKVQQ